MRCCDGRGGAIFDQPRRAQAALRGGKTQQGILFSVVWTASFPTLYASDAASAATARNPFTTWRGGQGPIL